MPSFQHNQKITNTKLISIRIDLPVEKVEETRKADRFMIRFSLLIESRLKLFSIITGVTTALKYYFNIF